MEARLSGRRPAARPTPAIGRPLLVWPALLALLVGTGAAEPLEGQAVHRLTEPDATFPEDFGAVQTVRALPDGRVLVADPLGGDLYAVDLDAGTRTVVGSNGQGPDEYRQPDAVWPLPGDSTLLVDLGNGRLTVLAPDLSFARTRPIAQGEFRPGAPPVVAIPQGVDGQGRVYFRSLPNATAEAALPDSAEVMRMAPDGTMEPVVRFKLEDRRVRRSGGAGEQNVSISPIPLSAQDAWGVAPDGSVVVARSGDYHLEWVGPDGARTRGPAVEWDPVDIGTPEKEAWVADQGRSGGGLGIAIHVENGVPSMSFRRGGAAAPREIDRYEWPDRKPPFHGERVAVDPGGRAWVHRHVAAGGPSTYDVFDRAGTRVGTVLLEPGNRLVGFDRDWVYVVSFDAFDLNYLERHPRPGLP